MMADDGGLRRREGVPALRTLGEFIAGLEHKDIPLAARETAKLVLGHNLLVALAARREHLPGQDLAHWPDGMPATATATRLTDGRRAPAERAVLTNALAMGARAQHDEHPRAISHFGSTVLPPLLAAAEQSGITGAAFVTAMVAGYEAGARVGVASIRQTTRRGFRPTGLYGPLAGAAATAKAFDLDVSSVTSALALALNAAAGLTQTWLRGTDEWRYQTACASQAAYRAAWLAGEGVRGAGDTLEGQNGFHAAYAGAPDLPLASVTAGLGATWAIEEVLLKPYPVCAINQAPVQQALSLKLEQRIDPDVIRRIRIRLHPEDRGYPGVDVVGPVQTRTAALMCVRTCVALALLHDDVAIAHLEAPGGASTRRLVALTELESDADMDIHTSTVTIEYGEQTVASSGAPRGTDYGAEVREALVARLRPLTGLDEGQMTELQDLIDSLDELDDVDPILAVVRHTM